MELLLLLVEQRGQLVTRDQIVERVWGKHVHLATDGSINAAVRKVRQAPRDDPDEPRFVQTISGKGYRFIAPVVEAEVEAPLPRGSEEDCRAVPFGYIPRNQFNEKASPSGARMGNPPDSLNCCYIAITLIFRLVSNASDVSGIERSRNLSEIA